MPTFPTALTGPIYTHRETRAYQDFQEALARRERKEALGSQECPGRRAPKAPRAVSAIRVSGPASSRARGPGGKEKVMVTGTGCSGFSLGSPGLPGEKGDKGLPGLDGIPGIKGEAGRDHISGHMGARGGRSRDLRLGDLWMTCGITPPPPVE